MASTAGSLPTGTLTFLRSDIEGSMRLTRLLGPRYDELNAQHQAIVRAAVAAHAGREVRTEGDAFFIVFEDASHAVAAAADVQRAMAAHGWPPDAPIAVRIGIHAGAAYLAGDDYGGFEVSRAARIGAVGSGGQIVLSDPVRALVADHLPRGCTIRDLGRHRLKDVGDPEHLFQLDVAGLRTEFPAPRLVLDPASHLPARTTSFIGREAEIGRLSELLDASRLLTLTGPGGTGKTSLALELARRHAAEFADGAWFADLQTVLEPALVTDAIARALGLHDGALGPAAGRLAAHLAERSMLLVVDNFEQVIDAAPEVVGLIAAAPGLRLIVTSRAPLRVGAEQEYPVRPLGVIAAEPPEGGAEGEGGSSGDTEAVRLFLDRAYSVRPDLRFEPEERATIARICRLLDGLPLAIELAAARVSSLPLSLIHDRLAARLPLPGTAPRDLPDRQRTLERIIAWSDDLLEPPVRRLLARAAVFEGGFDLEQAAAVCGAHGDPGVDVLDGLVVLVEQSLLMRDHQPGSGVRFRSLETIRSYGLARLQESMEEAALRRGHAIAYVDLAERAAAHLPSADQPRWLDRLALDQANIRAALTWSIEAGEAELALRLVAGSWRFWQLTGQLTDGRTLAGAALAMPGADAPTRLRLAALDAAGGLAYWGADSERAGALYGQQLKLARQLGDRAGEAAAAWNFSHTLFVTGAPAGAMEMADVASRLFRELGDEVGLARLDWARATIVMLRDTPERASAAMLAVLRRFEQLADTPYVAMAAGGLASVSIRQRDIGGAMGWALRALRTLHALRDVAGTTVTLQGMAVIVLELGRPDACATVLGAFEALCQRYGVRPPATLMQIWSAQRPEPRALEALGRERFEAAFARGGRMSLDEVVDLVDAIAAELGIEAAV